MRSRTQSSAPFDPLPASFDAPTGGEFLRLTGRIGR